MSTAIKINDRYSDKNVAKTEPLILGQQSFHNITEKISSITENKPDKKWLLAFGMALSALMILAGSIGYLV